MQDATPEDAAPTAVDRSAGPWDATPDPMAAMYGAPASLELWVPPDQAVLTTAAPGLAVPSAR